MTNLIATKPALSASRKTLGRASVVTKGGALPIVQEANGFSLPTGLNDR